MIQTYEPSEECQKEKASVDEMKEKCNMLEHEIVKLYEEVTEQIECQEIVKFEDSLRIRTNLQQLILDATNMLPVVSDLKAQLGFKSAILEKVEYELCNIRDIAIKEFDSTVNYLLVKHKQ